MSVVKVGYGWCTHDTAEWVYRAGWALAGFHTFAQYQLHKGRSTPLDMCEFPVHARPHLEVCDGCPLPVRVVQDRWEPLIAKIDD